MRFCHDGKYMITRGKFCEDFRCACYLIPHKSLYDKARERSLPRALYKTVFGYLTPQREEHALTGALFCSSMFPGRAPEGHVALAGYVGGARAPEAALAAPEDLIAETRAEFQDLLGARGEPVLARVRNGCKRRLWHRVPGAGKKSPFGGRW